MPDGRRRPLVQPEQWARFLALVADGSSMTLACRLSGMSRKSPYDRRRDDPAFATAWDDALAAGERRRSGEGEP
jgi:hypothetical protein